MNVLRLPQVLARIGLSRSTTYSMIATGEFPKPIQLGKRAVGWIETDITDWIANRGFTRPS